MSERSKKISKLLSDAKYRAEYIKSKLDVLIPSQLKALRGDVPQAQLARQAGMLQSRISAMETPGKTNFNLDTLVRLAATFKVALVVKFVPFSEILQWENNFSQDEFCVERIDDDIAFCTPESAIQNRDVYEIARAIGTPAVDTVMMDVTSPIATSASTIPNPQTENVGGQYQFRLFSEPVNIRSVKPRSRRRVAQPRFSRQRKRA